MTILRQQNLLLRLNEDMNSQYYGLRQYPSDTICYPIYDYVFAVKHVDLGSENIAVAFTA